MKPLLFTFLLTTTVALAEVPSLINYQGRLTGPGGAPASGTKNFALNIYDAATDGTLLYSEDVGAITLGEGGVYSFRFGGSGTSNTLVTETVGTGTDAVLYQKVLSNTPVVAGSVSVSDGTYTWSQASGSSNEDDFNAAFSTNLNRITVNYFAGAPDDGREISVTYRYGAAGIVGALSSGSGHWLQLTIDGDVQATRERVLAVPFALRAGVAESVSTKASKFLPYFNASSLQEGIDKGGGFGKVGDEPSKALQIPTIATGIRSLTLMVDSIVFYDGQWINPIAEISRAKISEIENKIFATVPTPARPDSVWIGNLNPTDPPKDETSTVTFERPPSASPTGPYVITIKFPSPISLDHNQYIYWLSFRKTRSGVSGGTVTNYKLELRQ